jgi:hypothetical protein
VRLRELRYRPPAVNSPRTCVVGSERNSGVAAVGQQQIDVGGPELKLTPDPIAVFPLDSSHPLRSSILSGLVALKQGRFSGSEPQTRVFGYTPGAAKGRTHSSAHTNGAENVSSLAAVSITPILRVEGWTCVAVLRSDVLTLKH